MTLPVDKPCRKYVALASIQPHEVRLFELVCGGQHCFLNFRKMERLQKREKKKKDGGLLLLNKSGEYGHVVEKYALLE